MRRHYNIRRMEFAKSPQVSSFACGTNFPAKEVAIRNPGGAFQKLGNCLQFEQDLE